MYWDQGDYPDGPDPAFRHAHHLYVLLHVGVLIVVVVAVAALVVLALPPLLRIREERRRALARERIYTRIQAALDVALKTSTGAALIAGAQDLVIVYDQHLGALTKLSEMLGAPMEAVRRATIPGKVKDRPARKEAKSAPADLALTDESGDMLVEQAAASPSAPRPEASKPGERDISMLEQIAAVRAAIEAFAEAWRRPHVDNLLRNLQNALLNPPAEPDELKTP